VTGAERAGTRLGGRGLTRRFGPVVANDGIDLAVAPGTVHALVGENGAGKTTLMRTLYGLERPDAGTVLIDDRPVRLAGPADALARGIGMVHQELMVVPELTLLENLVLGHEPVRGPLLDLDAARAAAAGLAERTGVELDWDRPAGQAPVSARQRLEILRLLYRDADTLILDEPTAVLAPPQVAELFRLLAGLRERGHTIVFCSHKLPEVLQVADVITVLRGGRVVATVAAGRADPAGLARMMVGEELAATPPGPGRAREEHPGEPVLTVEGLAASDDRGNRRLAGIDLAVRPGEIVGVAGVAGNGQDELVECLVGLRRPTGGRVRLAGQDVTRLPTSVRRRRGLGYVPADRARQGLALGASIADNAVAGLHRSDRLSRRGWFRPGALRRFAGELLDRFGVRAAALDRPVRTLSGGNQQRVVLARELAAGPVALVADQPTRGIDVKGIAFVHQQLAGLREQGAGVLLVSEELEELLAVGDRIVVLYRGRVAGEAAAGTWDLAQLGRLVAGQGLDGTPDGGGSRP
jgi:ABC-type uncharacterized transport system ATPase subunit